MEMFIFQQTKYIEKENGFIWIEFLVMVYSQEFFMKYPETVALSPQYCTFAYLTQNM